MSRSSKDKPRYIGGYSVYFSPSNTMDLHKSYIDHTKNLAENSRKRKSSADDGFDTKPENIKDSDSSPKRPKIKNELDEMKQEPVASDSKELTQEGLYSVSTINEEKLEEKNLDPNKNNVQILPSTDSDSDDEHVISTRDLKSERISFSMPSTSSPSTSAGVQVKSDAGGAKYPVNLPLISKESLEEGQIESNQKGKEEIGKEEREQMQWLISNFDEEQLERYETFRRAAFPKSDIKRIMQRITGCPVGQNTLIAMEGISKVFTGEVIETALDYMESLGESGPLEPKHLREAVRKLRNKSYFPKNTKANLLQ